MNGKAKILRPVLNILNILDATIYENAKIVGNVNNARHYNQKTFHRNSQNLWLAPGLKDFIFPTACST